MKLKFNLSLCNSNIQLKNECNKILDTASFGIRDKIIKALNKEITSLKRKRTENHISIKNKTTKENYKLIKKAVTQKVVILERNIKSRHNRKTAVYNMQLHHKKETRNLKDT